MFPTISPYGLKVPLGRAEQLKIEHGSALVDDAVKGQTITITSELGLPLNTINLEHLRRIMSLRLEEIFQLIAQDLEQAGLLDYLRAGVFLCGGGARISAHGATGGAEFCSCPCALGKTNSISGLKSALGSAGVRHAHRPGEIRLVQISQARRAAHRSCKISKACSPVCCPH